MTDVVGRAAGEATVPRRFRTFAPGNRCETSRRVTDAKRGGSAMVSEARAAQPGGRNVLDDLDSRIPTNFYWYLAVLACVGGFLFGYDTSNIGSALGFIPYHLSSFWTGYLVAGASLGAGAGALIAGPLTDRFGRKTLLITDAAIYAVGALLSAITPDVGVLL